MTLENSLLSSIDPNTASQTEITEAFCRDVDSFSWEFAEAKRELTFIEQLDENKWYILIAVVAFIYITIMLRSTSIRPGASPDLNLTALKVRRGP